MFEWLNFRIVIFAFVDVARLDGKLTQECNLFFANEPVGTSILDEDHPEHGDHICDNPNVERQFDDVINTRNHKLLGDSVVVSILVVRPCWIRQYFLSFLVEISSENGHNVLVIYEFYQLFETVSFDHCDDFERLCDKNGYLSEGKQDYKVEDEIALEHVAMGNLRKVCHIRHATFICIRREKCKDYIDTHDHITNYNQNPFEIKQTVGVSKSRQKWIENGCPHTGQDGAKLPALVKSSGGVHDKMPLDPAPLVFRFYIVLFRLLGVCFNLLCGVEKRHICKRLLEILCLISLGLERAIISKILREISRTIIYEPLSHDNLSLIFSKLRIITEKCQRCDSEGKSILMFEECLLVHILIFDVYSVLMQLQEVSIIKLVQAIVEV